MSLIARTRCGMRRGGATALALTALMALSGASRANTADAALHRAEPAFVFAAGTYALVAAYDYPYYIGAEYLFRPQTSWLLTPSLGLSFGREGIAFLRAGAERDFKLGASWFVTPSLAGGYFINGDYIGVVQHLQFQSGIAFSRRSQGGWRWGIAGYHVSNAALERPNNGTEAVVLFLRVPLAR
jgi:hypothetical protein